LSIEAVKSYYGKTLKTSADLKTQACCTLGDMSGYVEQLLSNIHDEVKAKYYGCGLLTPLELAGRRVLDLGSGSGRDAYGLAQLAGPAGEVIGVDMTAEQFRLS
jgi:SAM-dependent methyltransferase